MNERAELLRRRVALYRQYLAEGVEAELAGCYLREIVDAEAKLAGLEKDGSITNTPAPMGIYRT